MEQSSQLQNILSSLYKPTESDILGHWDWKHNGRDTTGELIFGLNGDLSYKEPYGYEPPNCSWKINDDKIEAQFGDFNHIMRLSNVLNKLSNEKRTLTLLKPARNPATIATFNKSLAGLI